MPGASSGMLETTPGKAINFKAIIARLAEINAQYGLVRVAYDRAFIKTFNAKCEEDGVKLPLEEFGQGFVSMSPAVQLLEAAVLDKKSITAAIRSCAGRLATSRLKQTRPLIGSQVKNAPPVTSTELLP